MRGGDSIGIRAFNERLVVDSILQAGSLSKAELSRATGLSANAATVIANRLIEQGLLQKCAPVRGQVGQPSTPIAVNPDGAYSIGITIGRRSVQSLLVDLIGEIIAWREVPHDYPEPLATVQTAISQCTGLLSSLTQSDRDRILGIGIAVPGEIQAWTEELGLKPGALADWTKIDIARDIAEATDLETTLLNDASAACAAEMIAGDGIVYQSALYIYFGTFIGGGIVLNGRLYQGAYGNAGSLGSMPVGLESATSGRDQLIHRASLLQLEAKLNDAGLDPQEALNGGGGSGANTVFQRWMDQAAPAVAQAIVSALSVVDFETVVIDGAFPPTWRRQLKGRIADEVGSLNLPGIVVPEIATGTIGQRAPALGAAMMPIRKRFSPDPAMVVQRSPASG